MVDLEIATLSWDPIKGTVKSKTTLIESADNGDVLNQDTSVMLEEDILGVEGEVCSDELVKDAEEWAGFGAATTGRAELGYQVNLGSWG